MVHKSNPGKSGKEREAILKFNRTIYKGIVNYIWKTIQTGLTNTIAPVGKTVKTKVTESKKELRKQRKEERKKEKTNNN